MSELTLALLGPPAIKLDGQPLVQLKSRKAKGILFYLVMSQQVQPREKLAGLFWGEFPEENARANLRGEIRRLRKHIAPHLVIERFQMAFDEHAPYELDVDTFDSLLSQPQPTIAQLETAVALYRGPFLANFYIPDAPVFDQWVESHRENYRQMVIEALYQLALHYTQQRQYEEALEHTQRLLGIEPWYEEAQRQMMLLLALDGQRGAALEQYKTCAEILAAEFGVEPGSATQELAQQIEAGDIVPDEVEGVYVPMAAPYQAPPVPAHFVGRRAEIEQVAGRLTAGRTPPVALVAMGGMGKTTLAAALAQQVRDDFPDGVLWANVAGGDVAGIAESWGRAFGQDFTDINQLPQQAAALRGVLAGKQVLLVFDDVDSAEGIRPLLPGGVQSQVLITTRNQETAAALGAEVAPVQALQPAASRELLGRILGERAKREETAVRDLCAVLHHLPLAIEIAGQMLSARPRQSVARMVRKLQDVSHRLGLRISDRAVRTSFAVSWEALNEPQRRLFALLGIFAGRAFTAEAVAFAGQMDADVVEEGLFDLSALSLVTEVREIHYQQHPLLADFAAEKLGAADEVYGRMVTYYLTYAQQYQAEYPMLSQEWDNLTAAMRVAHRQARWQLVLDFVRALGGAWTARGRYDEARQGYRWARAAAKALADDAALADCLLRWGQACLEQSDYETAVQHLNESLKLARTLGDKTAVAACRDALARAALEQSDYETAEKQLSESRRLWQQLGDDKGVATSLYWEARVLVRTSAYTEVKALCRRALALQQSIDDPIGAIKTRRLLARVAIYENELETAESHCLQALQLCREARDRRERAITQYTLSVIYSRNQRLEEAERQLKESIGLFKRMGNQKMYAVTLYALSGIEDRQGEWERALATNQASQEIFQTLGDTFNLVHVLQHQAQLGVDLGRLPEAQAAAKEALALARGIDHPECERLQSLFQEIETAVAGDVRKR